MGWWGGSGNWKSQEGPSPVLPQANEHEKSLTASRTLFTGEYVQKEEGERKGGTVQRLEKTCL